MATPLMAVTEAPLKVPEEASVRVTVSVKSTSVLPKASIALTTGCVVRADPLTDPEGAVPKDRAVAVTSIVEPTPFVTADVLPIWVPLPPTVRSVSPSTDRMNVRSSVRPELSL